MFPYDPALATIAQKEAQSIPEVLASLRSIDATCGDHDGLKWFNWLYLQVTEAVAGQTGAGGFHDVAWLAQLDVQFARMYLAALRSWLTAQPIPSCWQVLFEKRDQARLGRIQFAMAGINAHINHDLAAAIVATCQATGTRPVPAGPQHSDYTAVNATLEALIDSARHTLHLRLLGDILPPASALEDALAGWNMGAARELAWRNAEHLWHLRSTPALETGFLDMLDGFTTVIGKSLMIPVL